MKGLYFLMLVLTAGILNAANGDTTHVISHDNTTVVTNPSAGYNSYPSWVVFPSTATQYRKIIMTLHYECPDGMVCGEWDYIDEVKLRRTGGVSGADEDMFLNEYIQPYGSSFGSEWFAEFNLDITDFSMLLHDSVEIEYIHTGYETNVGKGWSVTVSFDCIEGIPAMEPIKITKLWNGSFPYGNAGDPIENYLTPIEITTQPPANVVRCRITQTGHGADNNGCSEFCSKYRNLYFDGILADTKTIWRTCGDNPIYPQGGTWIFDRANWCPGLPVKAEVYDFDVEGSSTHTINVDMQPYTSTAPSGNYYIKSYLIEYKAPTFENDATIDLVKVPSDDFEYSRLNPACDDPIVVIKNNGSNSLTSAKIIYGTEGAYPFGYDWTGDLQPGASEEVFLNGLLITGSGGGVFNAFLENVNGVADEYTIDNSITTAMSYPLALNSAIIINYKTNNIGSQNSYSVVDYNGMEVAGRNVHTDNTIYKDTLYLAPGCYTFLFNDTGGDGLDFWYWNAYDGNSDGTGYAKITDIDGNIIKFFGNDFGSELRLNFLVDPGIIESVPVMANNEMWMNIYPNPTANFLTVEMSVSAMQEVYAEVYTLNGNMLERKYSSADTEHLLQFDLSSFSAGIYIIRMYSDNGMKEKKIIIAR